MCIFDEYDTPLEIYSSSREWLAHMRSQHRMRWHCFATSHEPSCFESPDALEDHLMQIHAGHFSNEEISFLVENSRVVMEFTTPARRHAAYAAKAVGRVEGQQKTGMEHWMSAKQIGMLERR